MKVRFRVFGGLSEKFAELMEKEWHEFEKGMTLADFLDSQDMPPKAYWIATVNKNIVHEDYVLKDGDTIQIFPPIAGGY